MESLLLKKNNVIGIFLALPRFKSLSLAVWLVLSAAIATHFPVYAYSYGSTLFLSHILYKNMHTHT